jgi:ABC-type antimicrobial peptide transport system permease subunit
VVLATTIMAAGAIYFDSLEDLGLRRALAMESSESLDLEIHANNDSVSRTRHNNSVANVLLAVERDVGWFTDETEWSVRSSVFRFPATAEQIQTGIDRGVEPVGSGAVFALLPDIEDRINIVSGRPPDPGPFPVDGDSPRIEVMVSRANAINFNLDLETPYSPGLVSVTESLNPTVIVTGIYDRVDSTSTFWRVLDDVLGFGPDARAAPAVLVTPGDSFLDVLGPLYPNMSSSYGFLAPANTENLDARNAESALSNLNQLLRDGRASVEGFRMTTDLDLVIEEFDLRAFFNRAPMTIVGILVLLIVLYYAVTLASLLVDAQRDEFSLLRTRGAGSLQISSVYGVEAALIAIVAVVAGPPLAALVVHFAGFMPGVGGLNGGDGLPVDISIAAYQLAALGGLLSFFAMLVPALRASRVGLLIRRAGVSRGGGPSFFRRYYLDLVLLLLVVLLFGQLRSQGSLVGENLFGEAVVDQVTLASPALFLLIAGLVLLRLFPLSMEFLARGLSSRFMYRLSPETFVLGLWQLARNPASYSRLSLLFILTAGLGVFAANFATTLERSFEDRARYTLGTDVRVDGIAQRRGADSMSILDEVDSRPGVAVSSPVLRRFGVVTRPASGIRYELLAIDPGTFDATAWTRSDFFQGTLREQLALIDRPSPERGIELPDDSRWISARVKGFERSPDVDLVATMRDANGRFYTLLLGDLSPSPTDSTGLFSCPDTGDELIAPDWCEIGTTITPSGELRGEISIIPERPVTLLGFAVTLGLGEGDTLISGSVLIDEINVTMPDRRVVTVAKFDEPAGLQNWHNMGTALLSDGDTLRSSGGLTEEGMLIHVAELRWGRGEFGQMRGFIYGDTPAPVPVLASSALIDITGIDVGDEILVVQDRVKMPIQVVSEIEFFPTLNPNDDPFIVAPLEPVLSYVNTSNFALDIQYDEVWVRTEPGEITGVARSLGNGFGSGVSVDGVVDLLTVSEELAADPLTKAGWNALLGMSFVVVLLVSAFGFMVHAYVTYQDRVGEFALLRTIGLSMRQLLALVAVEQIMVLLPAIAVGIVMGGRVGGTIVPYLSNSGDGLRSVPPTITQIDWTGVALTLGTLGVVVVAVIVLVLIGVRRIAVQAVMRVAER